MALARSPTDRAGDMTTADMQAFFSPCKSVTAGAPFPQLNTSPELLMAQQPVSEHEMDLILMGPLNVCCFFFFRNPSPPPPLNCQSSDALPFGRLAGVIRRATSASNWWGRWRWRWR